MRKEDARVKERDEIVIEMLRHDTQEDEKRRRTLLWAENRTF